MELCFYNENNSHLLLCGQSEIARLDMFFYRKLMIATLFRRCSATLRCAMKGQNFLQGLIRTLSNTVHNVSSRAAKLVDLAI
jgi:hypothetical protein